MEKPARKGGFQKGKIGNPTGKGGVKKGEVRNPKGRPKGVPNKTTQDVITAILNVFDPVAFKKWSQENPNNYFTQVLTKIIPRDIKADVDATILFRFEGWTKPHG